MPSSQTATLVTMKWGTVFGAEDVNVLCAASEANCSLPLRKVCITDNPNGLSDDIEVLEIPQLPVSDLLYAGGAWPKLSVFAPDLISGQGTALFIDLDTVICGNLDPFFEPREGITCIDSAPWRFKNAPPRTGTGIFSWTLGQEAEIWDKFLARPREWVETYGIEQDYLHGEHPNLSYWPDGWVVSFKYHCRRPLILDRFLPPTPPPPTAKVLAFHGKPRPMDLIRPEPGNWDRFPHYGSGQVKWMADYWMRYGGEI